MGRGRELETAETISVTITKKPSTGRTLNEQRCIAAFVLVGSTVIDARNTIPTGRLRRTDVVLTGRIISRHRFCVNRRVDTERWRTGGEGRIPVKKLHHFIEIIFS